MWCLFNDVDCKKCNPTLQKIRGCESDIPPITIEGMKLTRCPMNNVGMAEDVLLEAYVLYEKGYLPNDGGWLKQPAKFTLMMNLIDNLFGHFRRVEDEKQEAKWRAKK